MNDFEELVRLSAADPRRQAGALLKLGRLCVQLNDLDGARRHFRNAIRIDQETGVFTPAERLEMSDIVQSQGPTASLP